MISKQEIDGLYRHAKRAWGHAIANPDPANPPAELLAKALNLIRDAGLIAANPKLKQMNCTALKSGIHGMIGTFSSVCGAQPEILERAEPRFCVPTCPDCVRVLTDGE